MELFSRIPGDDSVIDRIMVLDKSQFGYPDFPEFHLAQFVRSNIECVDSLHQLEGQVYFLIWLACKVDRNSADSHATFKLIEEYAHHIQSNVLHLDLAQFLDEVAETITEIIPAAQREKELAIFAHFLLSTDEDEQPHVAIMSEFKAANRCASWLQDRYVGAIIFVTSIVTLRTYFAKKDRLFRKMVRGLDDDDDNAGISSRLFAKKTPLRHTTELSLRFLQVTNSPHTSAFEFGVIVIAPNLAKNYRVPVFSLRHRGINALFYLSAQHLAPRV